MLYIAESVNRPAFVPKMPGLSELDLIFDTSFVDIQPYLFKVTSSHISRHFFPSNDVINCGAKSFAKWVMTMLSGINHF